MRLKEYIEALEEKKYEVIFAWNYIEWGGAQIYFLSLIKNSSSNWNYTILLPKNSKPDIIKFFENYNVKFDFIDTSLDSSEAKGVLKKLKRQWVRIKSEFITYKHLCKYDLKKIILHIETAPWQSWIFLYLLSLRGNVFVTMHNAMPHFVPKWRRLLWSFRLNFLMKEDRFHFFSANQNAIDSLKEYISPKYWNKLVLTRASINPGEIELVLNQKLCRNDILGNHNLPVNKFIVLCVGQFIDRKGRWILMEAAKQVVKIKQDVLFVWLTPQLPVGDDLKRAESFELGDSFKLILSADVGKKREEVLNFFRIADVFALPSLWEGLPIAVLEAMALGIPTISTNLNAIPEAVVNNETGLLIETGNAAQLTEAILYLYENKEVRDRLAKQGREFVIEKFDEKKAAQIALENYKKCLTR